MTLNEKIKSIRKNANYTQEAFAEKIMVSRQAVTKWETSKGIPDLDNLKTISKVFNVSLDWLINDQEQTNDDRKQNIFENTGVKLSSMFKGDSQKTSFDIDGEAFNKLIAKTCNIKTGIIEIDMYKVHLLSMDNNFVYYFSEKKKHIEISAISKQLIQSINTNIKQVKLNPDYESYLNIDKNFFVDKLINLASYKVVLPHIYNSFTTHTNVSVKAIVNDEIKIIKDECIEIGVPIDRVLGFEMKIIK